MPLPALTPLLAGTLGSGIAMGMGYGVGVFGGGSLAKTLTAKHDQETYYQAQIYARGTMQDQFNALYAESAREQAEVDAQLYREYQPYYTQARIQQDIDYKNYMDNQRYLSNQRYTRQQLVNERRMALEKASLFVKHAPTYAYGDILRQVTKLPSELLVREIQALHEASLRSQYAPVYQGLARVRLTPSEVREKLIEGE